MVEEGKAELSANAIIDQALKNAGVPPRNIEVPSEKVEQTEQAGKAVPTLDGGSKGAVKGESPEEKVEETEVPGTEAPKPAEAESKPELLSKADTLAAINEASAKFQSMMDGKINQLQFQMKQTVTALNQFFQSQEDSSIAGLPAEEQTQRRLERLEKGVQPSKIQIQTQQPPEQAAVQLYQQLANFVDAVGLKIDDKRIDWAPDVSDSQTGYNRFFASIKKALVEDQTKAIKDLKNDGDKVLTKLRKQTGVDKVSIVGPGGKGLPDIEKMTPMEKIQYGYQVQEELSQVNQ